MVKPIQELKQVAERLMQQAYQRGRAKSSGSSHRRCASTLPWLGAKVFYKSGSFFFFFLIRTRVEDEVQYNQVVHNGRKS